MSDIKRPDKPPTWQRTWVIWGRTLTLRFWWKP